MRRACAAAMMAESPPSTLHLPRRRSRFSHAGEKVPSGGIFLPAVGQAHSLLTAKKPKGIFRPAGMQLFQCDAPRPSSTAAHGTPRSRCRHANEKAVEGSSPTRHRLLRVDEPEPEDKLALLLKDPNYELALVDSVFTSPFTPPANSSDGTSDDALPTMDEDLPTQRVGSLLPSVSDGQLPIRTRTSRDSPTNEEATSELRSSTSLQGLRAPPQLVDAQGDAQVRKVHAAPSKPALTRKNTLFGSTAPVRVNQRRKRFSKSLSVMLEEMADGNRKTRAVDEEDAPVVLLLTRDELCSQLRPFAVFDRIGDLFSKFDGDGSGSIDIDEFTAGVMGSIANCDATTVIELFREFDVDRSGFISYNELKVKLNTAAERAARQGFVAPPLPNYLRVRKREVLQLHRQFEKHELIDERSMRVAAPCSFEECLRLYYPKDPKETISILVKWVDAVRAAKEAASEEQMRVSDEALVAALDRDGDGSISISEFLQLSKVTGLSKAQMRARFREKDYGNSGSLNMQQMREALFDLRADGARRTRRAAEAQTAVRQVMANAEAIDSEERKILRKVAIVDPVS